VLRELFQNTGQVIDEVVQAHRPSFSPREIGRLVHVEKGIARVSGLPGVRAMELLQFAGGVMGIAYNLDPDEVGVVLLGDSSLLRAGSEVHRTGRVVDVAVGPALLGRIVNALGHPLDEKEPLFTTERLPVEQPAPAILERAPVSRPLQTGIKLIDALIPIGRGQRQLILGDRQIGKTAIAVSAMLNQGDVLCVYCAIGQRASAVARVIAALSAQNALARCILVVAKGEDAPGLQFIAPYAATAMAEYFMRQGRDVLVVYDDLTRHAHAYRELSLLLRRPPGREAYPGDIFYIHSRLLERATQLKPEAGGGSLTALPIVETQAQNLSAYIPTNLISITDGQIYLAPGLFEKGELPAVDIGKSVSRVGGKAQLKAYLDIAGELRLSYTQFEELEAFARFGARLDDETRRVIERGRRVREALKQAEGELLTACEQISVLLALNHGAFDTVPLDRVRQAEHALRSLVGEQGGAQCRKISDGRQLDQDDRARFLELAQTALAGFRDDEAA
jgi:F-type H+-transporting ATPase subunit alpha